MNILQLFFFKPLDKIAEDRERARICAGLLWGFAFMLCISCFNHPHSFGFLDVVAILVVFTCLLAGANLFNRN